MRALESAFAGLALALAVLGGALGVVTTPWYTRTTVAVLETARDAELPPSTAAALAERVRAFSTRTDAAPLPAEVDGRPAFDAAAASHLLDVRAVFAAVGRTALAAAALAAAWLALSLKRRRHARTASALRVGSVLCFAMPVLAGVAGALDFERLFSAFHGLFFQAGTWTFPPDALLIQLFPERFWMLAGGVLGALVLLGGAVLWLLAAVARRIEQKTTLCALPPNA